MYLNVDHHGDNPLYGKINVVDAQAAASAQTVATIYDGLGVSFHKKVAETIYFGVSTDTGGFRFRRAVSPGAHELVAELLRADVVPAEVDDRINRTGTVEQLNIVGISLANTERYGKALISIVDNSDYRHTGATEVESEEVIDYLRTVACVEVVAPLRDNEGGIKASLRSGIVGVGAIAHTFGGGGQYSLVGGHTTSTAPSDAKEELLRVLEDVIDLGEIVGGIG